MIPAYAEYGDRRNPAILFLHGIRLGREIWASHARQLSARFHVVTLDLPGHGTLARVPFTQATVGELLDRTIDDVCTQPPLIVGYSLGGLVAMQYATRRPERTSGLLLAGCTLDFEGWKSWPYEAGARFAELIPAPVFDALLGAGVHLTLPYPWAQLVTRIPFNRDVLSRTSRIAPSMRFSETISAYRKPVQFVNGEYDVVFRMDERRYLQAVPQARLHVIRGADHTAPLRRAQEFVTVVSDFAGSVYAEAAP